MRWLVPRFFLFSGLGATARSTSGVAVAVSFRQNFILATLGDDPLKANTIFDGAKLRPCEHKLGNLVVLCVAKRVNLHSPICLQWVHPKTNTNLCLGLGLHFHAFFLRHCDG